MAVLDVVKKRRSFRSFDEKSVEEEKLEQVLEAGRLSPSAMNNQPWTFIVVSDPATKSGLNEAMNQTWNPAILVVGCAHPGEAWVRDDGEEYWKVDVAIAMQSMCLVASDLGLATCWICAFDEDQVKSLLDIPDEVRVVSLMALGYSSMKKGKVTKRKAAGEIFKYNSW
jgi:nitroreductase